MLTSKRPLPRREASPKRSTQGTPPAAAPSSVGSLGRLGASDVSNRERPACSRCPRPEFPWSPRALTAIVADPARAAAVSNATAVRFDTYIKNLRRSTWSAAGRTAPGLLLPRTPARGDPSPARTTLHAPRRLAPERVGPWLILVTDIGGVYSRGRHSRAAAHLDAVGGEPEFLGRIGRCSGCSGGTNPYREPVS